jgi:hypothetical protein
MCKKLVLLIYIALQGVSSVAQTPSLSAYEKRWAIGHPFAALKVKKISRQLPPFYNDRQVKQRLDSFSSGGQLDAFRHTFYMAAFAQKVKTKKLRKLGRAHEKANYRQFKHSGREEGEVPDSLGSVMDLANNELGFKIGSSNKNTPLGMLQKLVIQALLNGEGVVLLRNNKGKYVDCNYREITEQELRRWNTPKCLCNSALVLFAK